MIPGQAARETNPALWLVLRRVGTRPSRTVACRTDLREVKP